jgi:hypothetical protein
LIEEVLAVLLRDAKARGVARLDVLQSLLTAFDSECGIEASADNEAVRLILAARARCSEMVQREGVREPAPNRRAVPRG